MAQTERMHAIMRRSGPWSALGKLAARIAANSRAIDEIKDDIGTGGTVVTNPDDWKIGDPIEVKVILSNGEYWEPATVCTVYPYLGVAFADGTRAALNESIERRRPAPRP
jgi:exosome complex RNA-binding protein Csl4